MNALEASDRDLPGAHVVWTLRCDGSANEFACGD
jgi:hypothetical protein